MMKKSIRMLLKYKIWLAVLLTFNLLFGFLLWLQDMKNFLRLFPVLFLGSVGLYIVTACIVAVRDRNRLDAVMAMLEISEPIQQKQAELLFAGPEREAVETLGNLLREKNDKIRQQEIDVCEYEEYIEAWAHEIKTPLAMMTFMLDNRRDELSPTLYYKLEYVRTKMQEDVERMLYYARMKSSNRDYMFAPVSLKESCREVLEEYVYLMEEQKIQIINEVGDEKVITDTRGLAFCIRQMISNAVKYVRTDTADRWIRLSSVNDVENGKVILSVKDNGVGVKKYDLPFIFDKGFTGDKGAVNKTATGMGLYLAAQVAHQLKIELETPECEDGFEIRLVFRV